MNVRAVFVVRGTNTAAGRNKVRETNKKVPLVLEGYSYLQRGVVAPAQPLEASKDRLRFPKESISPSSPCS